MRHPLANTPLATVPHLVNNFFYEVDLPDLPVYVTPDRVRPGDVELCERLIAAFWIAHNEESERMDRPNEGVWEMVKHEFHGPTYKLLADRDAAGLAEHLCNGLREQIAYGIGGGAATMAAIESRNVENITLLRDRIVSCAVALGVLPIENPEQGAYGQNLTASLRLVVAGIEAELGARMSRPPAMGNFGFAYGTEVIDYRAPEDAYALHGLREFQNIAEIGGGFGGLAFQAYRSGRKVSTYDLPLMGVLQGYFLLKLIGDQVSLYGESEQQDVRVLPWFCFEHDTCDVVFNRDSMAEFPRHSAVSYLSQIKARGIPFYSINQEARHESGQPGVKQLRIADLAQEVGLQRQSRAIYPIRRGYAEEWYR